MSSCSSSKRVKLMVNESKSSTNNNLQFDRNVWAWQSIAGIPDIKNLLSLCRVCVSSHRLIRMHRPAWKSALLFVVLHEQIAGATSCHLRTDLYRKGIRLDDAPLLPLIQKPFYRHVQRSIGAFISNAIGF